MPDFSLNMHQIQFRLWLRPDSTSGTYSAAKSIAGFGEWKERGVEGKREGKGEGRGREIFCPTFILFCVRLCIVLIIYFIYGFHVPVFEKSRIFQAYFLTFPRWRYRRNNCKIFDTIQTRLPVLRRSDVKSLLTSLAVSSLLEWQTNGQA